jgi:nicotinate phosphoribosyltransferase
MADLSIKARKLLDEAGFAKTGILASNSLDEYSIADLKQQGAKINAWGVGTNLATAYDQPALDGVYKLSALRDAKGQWVHKLKLSEQPVKISNPGRHQIRRYFSNEQYVTDVVYDLDVGIDEIPDTVLLEKSMRHLRLDDYDAFVDLLQPVFRQGKLVQTTDSIHAIRKRALFETQQFYLTHGEQVYPVGLEKKLFEMKQQLIKELRPIPTPT